MTVIRSRRAGISPEEAAQRPLYAKLLGLQYLRPSTFLCFLLFEGTIALGGLLALAELAAWWIVVLLPTSVALMVKINDVIAGAGVVAGGRRRPPRVRGRASVPLRSAVPPEGLDPVDLGGDEWLGSPEQRARQAATRRYE